MKTFFCWCTLYVVVGKHSFCNKFNSKLYRIVYIVPVLTGTRTVDVFTTRARTTMLGRRKFEPIFIRWCRSINVRASSRTLAYINSEGEFIRAVNKRARQQVVILNI